MIRTTGVRIWLATSPVDKKDEIDTRYNANSTTVAYTTTVTRTYDGEGELLSEVSTATTGAPASLTYSDSYTYDLDGNRLTKAHISGGMNETTTNYYNDDDQLTETVHSTSGTTTYGYDANGNQLSITNGSNETVYGYDLRNRLTSITVNGVAQATYTYDDAGNRVSETSGGVTTFYLIGGNNSTGYPKPIETFTSATGSFANATLSMTYVTGNSVIAQVTSGGVFSYLLTDGHGNTRALVNSAGQVVAHLDYNAFDNALDFAPATVGTIWLTSDGMFDSISGLYFHGNGRQSNPVTGEFVEEDDITIRPGDVANANLYLYANANPINIIDPSGHDGFADLLVTMGIIGRIGTGIGFGVAGAWNLANSVIDVANAYEDATGDSPDAKLEIVGWMALAALQAYTVSAI